MVDGILFIDKPKGVTSRDVVNEVSHIFHTKKVGHTGTLDPLATGVLIIVLGKYTKLVDYLTSREKEYIATMKLGLETDTLDITGNILKKENCVKRKEEIERVFNNFPKEYMQEVPLYSAVKVHGKKLYEYGRLNEDVELPKRKVFIKKLEILEILDDEIKFKVLVSKGTYIRSLIRDIAKELQTVAVMSDLRRISQGKITIHECLKLDEINENTVLKKMEDVFNFPKIEISLDLKKRVINGNIIKLDSQEDIVFLTYLNETVAIYKKDNDLYKMVFKVI